MKSSLKPCSVRHLTLLGLALSGFWGTGPALADEETSAVLSWRNGDQLKGRLLESSGERIRWEAAPFTRPLVLSPDQLAGIEFPLASAPAAPRSSGAFRLQLKNGDRLEGTLESIDRETIGFRALPFQDVVRIPRENVVRLIHAGGDFLRYSGPADLETWSSSGRDRKITDWFTDLTGAFATHQWSGNLFREIEFPNAVEINFRAAFPRGFPNLEIGLVRGVDLGPMIETWDNVLVLTYRSKFVPVMELTEDTKHLDFRIFWNQSSGDLRLCDPSGKELAAIDGALVDRRSPDSTKSRTSDPLIRGFSILSRTPELKLLSLTVQEWDGKPPGIIDLTRPRLLIAGMEPRFETNDVTLSPGADSLRVGSRSFPLAKFQELILSDEPDPSIVISEGRTRLAYHDGTNLSGTFASVNDTSISISTTWLEGPLSLSRHGIKALRFASTTVPVIPGSDHLEGEGFNLRGALRPLGETNDRALTGWQPPGADDAVPFANEVKAKVTRYPHASSNPDLASVIGQARVYLKNNEILVGSLIAATPEKLQFTSRITGQIEIPSSDILAIDLGSSGRILEGFDDVEWEELEENEDDVELTRDTAVIRDGGFGNPSLILGDRIHFTARWDQTYGAMTLRLFTNGGDESSPSTDLIIAAQGNRLFVGKLKESGAFSFSGDQIPMLGETASFEIRTLTDKVEIFINGKSTMDIEVDPDRASGNGIYFKMGGGWQGWNQTDNVITITDFRIERTPGSIPRRIIDSYAREIALTLPRSLRDPVPTHVLVAPNGDLLRGRLVSAASTGVRFATGEEPFDLPLDRVSAIISLQEAPPVDGAPGEEPDGATLLTGPEAPNDFKVTHQFVLMDGSRLFLNSDRLENERFVGESSLLGTCTIAIENIREMKRGPETAAVDLEASADHAFQDWVLMLTPDPVIPGSTEMEESPLIGKEAPPVNLTMLDESSFKLSDHAGKVVVLDFWATWCGPCIKAMPDVRQVIAAFPAGSVTFCAINQAESLPIITRFLETREWEALPVALDFDMKVSAAYEVEGIPHTVVIGKDGKITWIHSGYSEDLREKLFDAIATAMQP